MAVPLKNTPTVDSNDPLEKIARWRDAPTGSAEYAAYGLLANTATAKHSGRDVLPGSLSSACSALLRENGMFSPDEQRVHPDVAAWLRANG